MKFADTSWWVAWSLPRDQRHADALTMLSRLGRTEQVLTTNFVVEETWTLLRRRDSHRSAVGFIDRIEALIEDNKLSLHRVSREQETRAWAWLRKHEERSYSFVDATSFAVMRDRRLREALAFDEDFAAAGFVQVQA